MGLTLNALHFIKKPLLEAKTVFSLGYPDVLASRADILNLFGVEVGVLNENADAKLAHARKELVETEAFLKAIGVEVFACCDLKKLRGSEIIADLNVPQDFGEFDLVIDAGTLEHCFNIGQAALNAANAVKVGGYVFHGNPLSMVNHGFYNLSPTWYHDFYVDNGWTVVGQCITAGEDLMTLKEHASHARFLPPEESTNLFLARREERGPMEWPVQTKYKAMLA